MTLTPPPSSRARRRVVASLLAVGTAVGVVAPEVAAKPQPVPAIEWADCGDGFECATAEVPRNHRRPRRGTIDIALVRRPTADRANRIGTLFLAHPLGTADLVRQLPPQAFGLLARFDVVGYDGRGATIDCGTDDSLLEPFTSNATRPGTEDLDAMVAAAEEYGRRCEERHGDLLPHMSTTAMTRDLDLLRAAVGDDKLTMIGTSQGSYIGAHYASMFPGRTRAMVLDAPVDAATWRDEPLQNWREQGVAFENTLDRFFAACAAHQDRCGFGGDDPESAFDALVDRLDGEPLPAPDPSDDRPVDGDEVRLAANDAVYDPRFWAPLAAALAEADAGDATAVRRLADAALNDRVSPAINRFFANNAVDQDYPDDVETLAGEGRHVYGLSPHFWAEGVHINFVEGLWPARSRDVFDGDFHNPDDATPILIIGGTHDPATPYRWAERLAVDLGNARLVTFDSDGHGAINDLDPCVVLPVVTYLTDPTTLPPEGLVCEQQGEPFGP